MLEIEIKTQITAPDKIPLFFQKIKQKGYVEKKVEIENDYYYNHPCRDFSKTDEALRIRVLKHEVQLTYKGPKISSKSKTRVEHEVTVNSEEEMKNILEKLGFIFVARVYKERKVFTKKGMILTVDYLPEVGWFSELEIQEKEEVDFSELEIQAINELKDIFGENTVFIRDSYLEIMLKQGILDNYPKENITKIE